MTLTNQTHTNTSNLFITFGDAVLSNNIGLIKAIFEEGFDATDPSHINSCVRSSFIDNDAEKSTILKALIQYGADVNCVTTTSLNMLVFMNPLSPILKILLDAGFILTDDSIPFVVFLYAVGLDEDLTPLDYMNSAAFDPKHKTYCLLQMSSSV